MRGARASSRATIRRRRTRARGDTRPRRSRREWRAGATVVSAVNSTDSPFKVRGPGSNLADHTLLEVTAGGELIIAGGTGNGYRLAEIDGREQPVRMVRSAQGEESRRRDRRLHPALLQSVNQKGQTNEVDVGSHPASEPARAPGRAAGRRGFYSRDLGDPGSDRARRRRGESRRVEARDGRGPGTRGVESRALDPGQGVSSSPIRRSRASRRQSRRGTRTAPTPTGVGCNHWSRRCSRPNRTKEKPNERIQRFSPSSQSTCRS